MRNVDLFDDYLLGNLSPEDKKQLENRLKEDAELKAEFNKHKLFVNALQYNAAKNSLKDKLKNIHESTFGKANVHSINQDKSIYQKYIKPTGMAASVAILAVITTLAVLSGGGYLIKKQNSQYEKLSNEFTTQEALIEGIKAASSSITKQPAYVPANTTGTGFAINNNGYLLTCLHVVKGSDSIFIGGSNLVRAGARVVYTNTKLDIAILKVDSAAQQMWKDLPYTFKPAESDLGEKTFTLGYPSQDIVYGEGVISSSTGMGDTSNYQISIPINKGNSGGPLLDEQGNIIGIINGKKTNAEGTGYASKSSDLIDIIKNIDDEDLKKELALNKRNSIKGMKRSEQIKRITPFVFNIYVYKGN